MNDLLIITFIYLRDNKVKIMYYYVKTNVESNGSIGQNLLRNET